MFFLEFDTVKSDCPVQIFIKMIEYLDLLQTIGLLLVLLFLEILKKKR